MSLSDNYLRTYDFHDGSHYQRDAGPFDAVLLAQATTDHPVVGRLISWKATQGIAYTDPTFTLLRNVFVQLFDVRFWYHWLSSSSDPVEQAHYYLSKIGTWTKGDRCSIDAEEAGVTVEKVVAFAERVEAVTHEPCTVYTGMYVAGGSIWKDPRVRTSKYGPRIMHLAAYVTRTSLLNRMTLFGITNLPMHLWQYSSNGDYTVSIPGSLPGVTGRADLNHVCDWNILGATVLPLPDPKTQENLVYISNDYVSDFEGQTYQPGQVWYELLPGGYGRHVTTEAEVRAALGGTMADCVNLLSVRRSKEVIDGIMARPVPTPPAPVEPPPTQGVVFPNYHGSLDSLPGSITLTPLA